MPHRYLPARVLSYFFKGLFDSTERKRGILMEEMHQD